MSFVLWTWMPWIYPGNLVSIMAADIIIVWRNHILVFPNLGLQICRTKCLPWNQKRFLLYSWKVSSRVIKYLFKNLKLIMRSCIRVLHTHGLAPIASMFWLHKHWQFSHDSDNVAQCFRAYTFIVYQTKCYEYFLCLSASNLNKNSTFLFA